MDAKIVSPVRPPDLNVRFVGGPARVAATAAARGRWHGRQLLPLSRCQHCGDPPTVDQQIGSRGAAGEDDRPAGDPEIDGVGHDAYLASSSS